MRWIGYVATILWWLGVVRALSSLNRGHSYKISPKPCRVPGPGRNYGTCMFVWECIKSEGIHVGVCVDSFMFGSCCVRNETGTTESTLHQTESRTTERSENTENPIYGNAERPSTLFYIGQVSAGRPFQKRPQAKPEFNDYEALVHKHKQQKPLTLAAVAAAAAVSSGTNAAAGSESWSKIPQDSASDGGGSTTFNTFEDKMDDYGSTLASSSSSSSSSSSRLPAKNQPIDSSRTRPPPGSSSSFFFWNNAQTLEEKEDEDSVAHETVHRPYLYERPEEKSTSTYRPISIIDHDARPNFVSRPEVAKKPTKSRTTPKPEAPRPSGSGFPGQTTHWRVTTEPAFVTKLSTTITSIGASGSKNGAFSSEHAWTSSPSQLSSSAKPHSTDEEDPLDNDDESHEENRPSFESTESTESLPPFQQIGESKPSTGTAPAAHYITTDDLGTAALTRPRPTKKRKPSGGGGGVTTLAPVTDRPKNRPTTAMTPPTFSTPFVGAAAAAASLAGSTVTKIRPTTMTKATTVEPTTTLMAATSTTATTATTAKTTTTTTTTTPSTTRKNLGTVPTVSAVGGTEKTECGVPPLFPQPETRIVGGKDAPFGRWPWQVSVRRTSFFGFSSTHRCGGAVLNANWIATAGHCVDDLLTSQIRIRVGDYDFSSVQERLPYVERGIAKKVVHPKYNFFTYEYDLALVRLESALVFAPHVSPICLPGSDDLLIGENATVTGWGRLSEGGMLPSVLQEVSVPIVSNDRCKTMFFLAGRHEFIPEIFLCAGYETGGHDSCQGDSGGPLQVRGKDGRYFLAGIISWGIGCAEANLPGVCTRISKFVPWILKNVT